MLTDNSNNTGWSSEILDAIEVEGFIQYIIEVTQNDHKWLIRRNYKEFQSFHKKLTQQTTVEAGLLPKLPPRSYNVFGPSEEFLEKRRSLLQDYLHNLAETPALCGLEDVTSFLQPERYQGLSGAAAGELPVYYPVFTSEDLKKRVMEGKAYCNIKYKNKKTLNYFINYGQTFLRDLFIFESSLFISTKPVAKAIIFDRKRASVKKAARFFAASADVLRSAVSVAAASEDSEAAAFLTKCLDVSAAAARWCATFNEEEAAVVRVAAKSPQAEVREIEWYKREVAKVVANFDPYATTHPLEDAKRLYMLLSAEIRCRSQVEQVVAVKSLRPLMYEMSAVVRFASTKKTSKAAAPPPDVIRVHFKRRYAELERAVSLILARNNSLVSSANDVEEAQDESNDVEKVVEEEEKIETAEKSEKVNDSTSKKISEEEGEKDKDEDKDGDEGDEGDDHSLFDMEDFVLCDGGEDEDDGDDAAYSNVVLSPAEVDSRIKQLVSDVKRYKESAPRPAEGAVVPLREGEDGPVEPVEKVYRDIDEICENALELRRTLEENDMVAAGSSVRKGKYKMIA